MNKDEKRLTKMLWLHEEGFIGYAITKTGEIWTSRISFKNPQGDWLQMKLYTCSRGYIKVGLRAKNRSRDFFLHRLLARTFLPNPFNLPFINHKDGDKSNNSLDNLEWCTCRENIQHAYDTGLKKPSNTKPVIQIDPWTGKELASFDSSLEAARALGMKNGCRIAKCASGHPGYLTSGGYMWRHKKEDQKLFENRNIYNKALTHMWYKVLS